MDMTLLDRLADCDIIECPKCGEAWEDYLPKCPNPCCEATWEQLENEMRQAHTTFED
jgi:hypothetical protein